MDLITLTLLIHSLLASGELLESDQQALPGCTDHILDSSGKVTYVCKGVEGYFPKKLVNSRKTCCMVTDSHGTRKQLCYLYDPEMPGIESPCKKWRDDEGEGQQLPATSSPKAPVVTPVGPIAPMALAANADNSFMFVSMLILLCLLAYGVLRSIPIIIYNQRQPPQQPQV